MNRQSIESDRLHLLSRDHDPPSTLTSRAPSVLSRTSSHATLKANKTTTDDSTPSEAAPPLTKSATLARRFTKSEEEYLSALRAWVEEKQYISLGDTTLEGFYGKKTMDMYAAKPGLDWGRKKRGKSQGQISPEDLDVNGRRRTIAVPGDVRRDVSGEDRGEGERRKSVRAWLGRR